MSLRPIPNKQPMGRLRICVNSKVPRKISRHNFSGLNRSTDKFNSRTRAVGSHNNDLYPTTPSSPNSNNNHPCKVSQLSNNIRIRPVASA